MRKKELYELIAKYRAGQCSAEEVIILMSWLDKMHMEKPDAVLPDAMQSAVKAAVLKNIQSNKSTSIISWRKWAAAAAILPVMAVAGWWWKNTFSGKHAMAWTKVSTGLREVRQIQLPDGSQVWLNAASSLEYPNDFNKKERIVRIKGQGFFDVEQDISKPFMVEAENIHVKVLGTSFSVTSTSGQPARVAVATGKVQVTENDQVLGILHASQQLIIAKDKAILSSTDSVNVSSWTTGETILNNVQLQQVLWELERFYGIKFNTHLDLSECRLTVNFSSNMTLQNKLDIISKIVVAPRIHFTTTDNKNYLIR
ncbi:FecR family protein [Chitinophaga sp. Hz27]|uniref:FecR family protein n=1 Tax=Chitinophaga sp. Hz27 TaxID=3347169 RepID=UPI0035DCC34F